MDLESVMVIRFGGYRWEVESRDREMRVDGTEFVDLKFRRVDAREEELELGWTPRSEPLDAEVARILFALAGRRRWTDPRSDRRYSVELSPSGSDEYPEDGPLCVRFFEGDGPAVSTVYPLTRPLGLAKVPELQAMLDAATEQTAERKPSRRSR